ncbi:MAG: hypothetical protein JXB34_10580 [Bacteroidales bacterium]|nr:hypothetical protein [Bacteroidales bacterium]
MKNLLLFTLAITLFACQKEETHNSFNYDFKIIRGLSSSERTDSNIFYYNNNQKLLAYDYYKLDKWHRFSVLYAPASITVKCESPNLLYADNVFYNSSGTQIDSAYYQLLSDSLVLHYSYIYEAGKLISCHRRNTLPQIDYFYWYNPSGHFKDSIVPVPYIDGNYTIKEYLYTDTLKPAYMVDESGLFEYPATSGYLPNTITTTHYIGGEPEIVLEQYHYTLGSNKITAVITENGATARRLVYERLVNN